MISECNIPCFDTSTSMFVLTFSSCEEATEHLFIRFRRYDEYSPLVAGRYRIIELIEAGWQIKTISEVMQISRSLVYFWRHRFEEEGIVGLYDKPPVRSHFEEVISIEDIILLVTLDN